jgi:class 3 adenylate cyclase
MAKLSAKDRANLPDRAFAYIASNGRRSLPIHDEAHVRNALARFERVAFESDAARDRARQRLLTAAKKYGIMPVGFVTGQLRSDRSARSPDLSTLPTGSVTFLLADMEASTTLLQQLGNAYPAVLKDVRDVILNNVRHSRGFKVDAHGDEYFAVFQEAAAAVMAAVDIQLAMGTHGWPDGANVRVRIGVHSGRPTMTDSGYVGLSVHTVARICSVGHGGQIVVSARTRESIRTGMPAGVRLRSLGRHQLAGLTKREAIYQVYAKGLLTDFPPPRT